MFFVALQMLLGDRAKYLTLISGLTFAVVLMVQQTSIFCGLMIRTISTIRNAGAPVWVTDPDAEYVDEVKPLAETALDRVRSVEGVGYAVPFYSGIIRARLLTGKFQNVQLIGLDSTTLLGRPATILEGRIEDLSLPEAVAVDELGIEKLNVGIGDVFEMNDQRARVVALVKVARSFQSQPIVYTTFERAMNFSPPERKKLSYVLVQPKEGYPPEQVVSNIRNITGLGAYTRSEFSWKTIFYIIKNTGIAGSIGTTIVIGLVVGIAISGQTFNSFAVENLKYFGTLKAMGAGNGMLRKMILLQALISGLVGYGLGVGVCALFYRYVVPRGDLPFLMPWQLLVGALVIVLVICSIASLFAIRRVVKLEPAIVFRG